jgi:hypothetical protein
MGTRDIERPLKDDEATNIWLAEIHLEDFPSIDPDTEEGKEELMGLAFAVHRRRPAVTHVVFKQDGEQIGEMLIPPPKAEMQ